MLVVIDRALERASERGGRSVAIARQPILDRGGSLCAYELLYRPLPLSGEGPDDAEAASAGVIVAALAEIGLERLVADQPAYINVTRQLLLDLGHLPVPPDRIVLELIENQLVMIYCSGPCANSSTPAFGSRSTISS